MEEESLLELLQRYRRDRRVLLNFILSGTLIQKVIMPPGAVSLDDVDLDQVSVDHVLSCAKKGGTVELSEAIRYYHSNVDFPPISITGSTDEFFLITDPELSGSPPRRAPPRLPVYTPSPSFSKSHSLRSREHREHSVDDVDDFEDDDDDEEVDSPIVSRRLTSETSDLTFSLPSFATGVTDDDIRETAYEILLSSAGAAGGLIVKPREKKKGRRARLMMKLAGHKSDRASRSQRAPGLAGLLETMRVQMEISESMDTRTKQALLNALVGKAGKRMDTFIVPLELLCYIPHTEFSEKKSYLRWQKRQLNILEEGFINHPAAGFEESGCKSSELRSLMKEIEESESLPSSSAGLQRSECLRSLREIVVPLSERPVQGDITGEVCHWADGYHLNVMLYEKLLFSVFDILEEGKLTEEVEEILELIKLTWKVLGVTDTVHYMCYAWVLFRQFVVTREQGILRHAVEQLKKIPLLEQRGHQDILYLKNLCCKVESKEGVRDSTFLQSFLTPIQRWADKQLNDYHLHFAGGSATMEEIVSVALVARRLLLEEPEAMQVGTITEEDQIESYISSSIKKAFAGAAEMTVDSKNEHPLASLAEEAKQILQKDSTLFLPILRMWNPRATAISASLIHKLYGNKLKPFLDGVEHLTEDAISVLPAADSLEQYVVTLITSACKEEIANEYCRRKLCPYQVESISGKLVSNWLNSQLERMLGWVERAIQQEHWDPISTHQRHGSSIVEVYRIVEETADQFFALKVPMRPRELNALFCGIDNAFQVYTEHITDKLVCKEDLIPPVPILTRYKKETGIKAFVKKELIDPLVDHKLPDAKRSNQIDVLTVPKLCVQLNSLHYALNQLNKLEEIIWEQWERKKPRENFNNNNLPDNSDLTLHKDPLDRRRKDINAAIDRICEFTGTKVIFWDLREPFINNLYKPNVSESRLEVLIEPLDLVLNQLCDIIIEPLRDRIVTGLLQVSLAGLLRVLLDGGPPRLFLPADAELLEEDLELLKEFFISGGDGLPRGTVETLVSHVRNVIKLHGFETRELINDLKSVSSSDSQGNRSKPGADTQTLLRILCHRCDSEASQFVKKQYKIPKSTHGLHHF